MIATHKRSYKTDDIVFSPLHYLPLIEHKINAFVRYLARLTELELIDRERRMIERALSVARK